MPFKSEAQRRFMYSQHPEIAKKWEDKTKDENLPERKRKAMEKLLEDQK